MAIWNKNNQEGRRPKITSNNDKLLADNRQMKNEIYSHYASSRLSDIKTKSRNSIKTESKNKKKVMFTMVVLLFVLVVLLIIYISPNPKIKIINSSQDTTLIKPVSTYQKFIDNLLRKSVINRTKLTIDTINLEKTISQQFPEFNKVEVTLPLIGNKPTVVLVSAKPTFLLTSINGSFVVGSDGRVIANASNISQTSLGNLPVVQDDSGVDIVPGKIILPIKTVEFINQVIQQLAVKNIAVTSLVLPRLAGELHVKIKDKTYYIKFNFNAEPRQAIGTFLAVKKKIDSEHLEVKEYIDVRVEERAYYK